MSRPPKPEPSLETRQLREMLRKALATPYLDTGSKVGTFTCGVYAFFDFDDEPIYVGQTFEGLSSRIGRHLTNQRTDAVAMSVLDPFEVCYIELFPLVEYNNVKRGYDNFAKAKSDLNQLELAVYQRCLSQSNFGAVLNEKDPAPVSISISIPLSMKHRIVSDEVFNLRGHPDIRLARRAQTMSRLAQVISERQVNAGLRRTLLVQAQRLEHLARTQFQAWGGQMGVSRKGPDDDEEQSDRETPEA